MFSGCYFTFASRTAATKSPDCRRFRTQQQHTRLQICVAVAVAVRHLISPSLIFLYGRAARSLSQLLIILQSSVSRSATNRFPFLLLQQLASFAGDFHRCDNSGRPFFLLLSLLLQPFFKSGHKRRLASLSCIMYQRRRGKIHGFQLNEINFSALIHTHTHTHQQTIFKPRFCRHESCCTESCGQQEQSSSNQQPATHVLCCCLEAT